MVRGFNPHEKTGERLSPKRVQKLFNRTGHKLGFQVTPHIVRTTQAAVMVNNHANDFEITQAMGHSDIRATQIYLKNVLGKPIELNVNTIFWRFIEHSNSRKNGEMFH